MAAAAKFGVLKIKKQLKQPVRNNVRFSRRNATLSYIYNRVNRMNNLLSEAADCRMTSHSATSRYLL